MNKKKTINPPMNPGISLLLVVFLVLCLFTFSAITLASSLNEKTRVDSLALSTKDYYNASNYAEHELSKVTTSVAKTGNWTIERPMDFEFKIDDNQVLDVKIVPLTEPKPGKYFTIEKWQVKSTIEWETDNTMNLYQP